jgi:hypothetical protein
MLTSIAGLHDVDTDKGLSRVFEDCQETLTFLVNATQSIAT